MSISKTLYIYTIFCEVTLLRRKGKRLKRSELSLPVRGRLSFTYRLDKNPMRNRKVFDLFDTKSHTVPVSACVLVDPVLQEFTEQGAVWRGYEIAVIDGEVYEFAQLWLVRQVW